MKSTTGLILAALGAILAFAVHGHLSFLNPNTVGWVLLLVGIAGLFLPPGTRGWLRHRLILRGGTYGPAYDAKPAQYSRHLMPAGVLVPDGDAPPIEGIAIEEHVTQG